MHTTELGNGWRAHHDGAPSGESDIQFVYFAEGMTEPQEHKIPFSVVHDLVASIIIDERISELEQQEPAGFLGYKRRMR